MNLRSANFLLLAILSSTSLSAQQPLSEQKRTLINKLIEVSDLASVTRKAMSMMASQFGANLNDNLAKSLPGTESMTPAQREEAFKLGQAMGTRVMKRMFDTLSKEIDYKELIDNVYIPVYDKFYTEEDLKGLIAFYTSPVGLKFVKVMPDVTAETTRLSQQTMSPKIMKIVTEIMGDEMAKLQEDLKKIKR